MIAALAALALTISPPTEPTASGAARPDPAAAAVQLQDESALGPMRRPAIARILLVDAFGVALPAQVFLDDGRGGVRVDVYGADPKSGEAPVLSARLSARRATALNTLAREVASSLREPPPETHPDSSRPEEFYACADAWGALIEVGAEGRAIRRERDACQTDRLGPAIFDFALQTVDDIPVCRRVGLGRLAPGRRLQACASLHGDQRAAAEVFNRFIDLARLDPSQIAARGPGFFTADAVLQPVGEAPAVGPAAIVTAWLRNEETALQYNRIDGESGGRVRVAGSMNAGSRAAAFTQDWVLDRGVWRISAWTLSAFTRPKE